MTPEDYIKLADEAMATKHPAQTSAAQHFGFSDIEVTFCKDYQQAKKFLQFIAPALAWIPNGGAVGSIILTGLLNIGDSIYNSGCSTTTPSS